jgi:hypothetical protein
MKEIVSKINRTPTEWEKIVAVHQTKDW